MATKKPSGQKIGRSGNAFTFSWKRGDSKYTAQQVQYNIGAGWRASGGIAKGTTSKTEWFNLSNTITSVSFRVRGKKGKAWSAYVSATYTLYAPYAPNITAQLDENTPQKCTFEVKTASPGNDSRPFVTSYWESILVPNCDTSDGSKLDWGAEAIDKRTGSDGADYSVAITEDSETLAVKNYIPTEDTEVDHKKWYYIRSGTDPNYTYTLVENPTGNPKEQGWYERTDSYTRWFRARSKGPAGYSAWTYSSHIYASPFRAKITSMTVAQDGAGYEGTVFWESQANTANPIQSSVVQYAMCVPEAGMVPPNGTSWNDLGQVADMSQDNTNGTKNRKDGLGFSIDGVLKDDECLFLRVNTKWDNRTTYGEAKLAYVGKLKEPSNVSVDFNTNTISATNESQVSDSQLAVIYRDGEDSFIIGIIPRGSGQVVVRPPQSTSQNIGYGVFAFVGEYTRTPRADEVTSYEITNVMSSIEVWQGGGGGTGSMPVKPENVKCSSTSVPNTVRVLWDWTWEDATRAVLSWADHEDAWWSTDAPQTYEINNPHASFWNIGGLATGKTWYIRVRLDQVLEETTTEGPWSDIIPITLSSEPVVPTLTLGDSKGVVSVDEDITLFWNFESSDGTEQADAKLYADDDKEPVASVTSERQITIRPSAIGWNAGEAHSLRLVVTAMSGKASSVGDPINVIIVPAVKAEITATTLDTATQEEEERLGSKNVLRDMPFSITCTGAGEVGRTTVSISRAENYPLDRPDESRFNGFEGESIAIKTITGEGQVEFDVSDLIGSLDDGAKYNLRLVVKDEYGQTDTVEMTFGVAWEHQATMPEGTVEMVYDGLYAKLTPIAVEGMSETDTCDIYRLSTDEPELVIKGGTFGTVYVDPYPAIGGGYRFVCVTKNGDYITAENDIAYIDVESGFEHKKSIIDFDGEQVQIYYNVDVSHNWEKDFVATRYLGGSVKGDWNEGVEKSTSVSTVALTKYDVETVAGLRSLAEFAGICNLRTVGGASFKADMQVSESDSHKDGGEVLSYSISCTRVDAEEIDGMTLAQWSEGDELE